MRQTLTYTLLFVYLSYLLMSAFPVITYCMYRNVASIYMSDEDSGSDETLCAGDFSYLKAIKERAGLKDEPEKNAPPTAGYENVQITCIVNDMLKTCPQVWQKNSKSFFYLNQYIENFPEVAVPPPKSA